MFSLFLITLACAPSDYGFSIGGELLGSGPVLGLDDQAHAEVDGGPSGDGGTDGDGGGADGGDDGGFEAEDADGVDVGLAWSWGTAGDDRATAVARLGDGSVLAAGTLGGDLSPDLELGTQIIRLAPDGSLDWSIPLATAGQGVVVETLLPTSDGGAWVCASAPAHAFLAPGVGDLPQEWGASFLMIRVDGAGDVRRIRALGSEDGGIVRAGCGQDGAGMVVIDGTVVGGPVEMMFEYGRMLMPTVVDRGFAVALDDSGWLLRVSTWDGSGLLRETSAVRPDGSLVQVFQYVGVPGVSAGLARLDACPSEEVCTGLIELDSGGSISWVGSLGAGVEPGLRIAATAGGEILLAARLGEHGGLPQADGERLVAAAASDTTVARYGVDLNVDWVTSVSSPVYVESLAENTDGRVYLGMWTSSAEAVQVGERSVELEHRLGTMAFAALGRAGGTSWLWSAGGDGVAWPTDMAAADGELVIGGFVQGEVILDEGGPTEMLLDSELDELGQPSSDLVLLRLSALP